MLKMQKTIASTLIVTFLATMLPIKVLAVENSYNQYEEKEVVEEVKESKIVKEEEEKREKNIKHFLKEDSTYEAVVYPEAVHYKEDGNWKEIDNSLVESKDEEFKGTQKPEEKEVIDDNTLKESHKENTQEENNDKDKKDKTKEKVEEKLGNSEKDEKEKNLEEKVDLKREEKKEENKDNNSSNIVEQDKDLKQEEDNKSQEEIKSKKKNERVKSKSSEKGNEIGLRAKEGVEPEIIDEHNNVLENKDNDFKVRIAKRANAKKIVKIQKGKYEVSWGVYNANESKYNIKPFKEKEIDNQIEKQAEDTVNTEEKFKSATNKEKEEIKEVIVDNEKKKTLESLNSIVEFKDVYPNVDMELEIKSDFLKENIIVNNPIENPEFKYRLYTKNLKVKINENKEILFFDNIDGKEIFTMEIPYMIDNQGELSKDIDVQCIEREDGVQELVIKPNKEWLNAPERAYPVKIDPPVRSSLDVKKIQDAFVASGLPTQNYREADRLGVGNGKYSKTTRSFLKFDLPQISSADMIIDAKLYSLLFSDQNNNTQINVHKVLGNWDSKSITWNRKPNFSSKVEDYAIVKGKIGSVFHWDITAIAKEWYNSGNNYGVMLKNNNESSGYTEFLSSDTDGDFKSIRPQVVFYYVNNSGLEDYWSYHSQEVGRAGTGHVNDYNGNLVFIHDDLSTNGNLMPASISHVYNSNEKDKSIGFGLGWRLNYYQTIEPKTIEGKRWYEYTDSDGTKHYFKYDDKEKVYKEESGLDLKFKINSDGSYEIKDKDDNTLTFTKWGYLRTVKDKNNNKLTIGYNGNKVSIITDGAGKQIKFDVLPNGYLVGITDPAGRKTSFNYNGIQLSKITYPDGKYTLYEYNSDNTLKLVTNYDGYQMQYEYYGSKTNRVKKVLEKHSNGTLGGELFLVYGFNQTTFKDVKGRSHIYQFNDNGNTVSVKDTDGSAEYYKYFDKENNKNKLELESKLQKTTKNYLKNHNIELNNTEWAKDSWTGSTGSADVTSEDKYLGNKSLKVNKTNDTARQFYSQSLNLEKGKTYTLSAYVKTKNISNKNSKGAGVFVNYQDNKGKWETVESRFISGSNDWDRLEVKFTLPKDSASNQVLARAGIMSETGVAYFDSFQLEEGSIANRYNMLENANFMYTSGDKPLYWTKAAECDSGDKYEVFEGRKTFKINGNANKEKCISQTISASGKKGDTFVVSGWGKADSVPTHSRRYFALDVGIKKKGSNEYQWGIVPFNQDSSQWQFVSEKVVAKHDYDSITVYGLYYLNANTAHFSDIQLFKEEFGQSYAYDSKGNVISVEDLAKQKSKFEYNGNNDLIKSVDPKGNEFKYEYDGKRNVTKATTSENVVYSFTYDSKGNPLTSKISGSGLFMESSAEYTANGNYMKSMTDSSGNKIGYDWNETKGLLNKSIDAKGNETNYKYDNLDRVISVDKDIKNESLVQIPFNHNLNNNSGIQPIESQSVTFERDIKGDMNLGAFQSTYNLLSSNSSFENTTNKWALTDWNKSTGKWRLVQDGAVGKYSLECYDSDGKTDGSITNAIAYQDVEYQSPTTEGKILSLSAYAKRIGNVTPGLSVVCYDNSGNEIEGSYKIHMQDIIENKWCRISKEFNVPKGTKKVRAVLRSNVKDKELVRFDGVQLEEKPFPTPYTDNRRSGGTTLKYNFNINDEEGAFSSFFKLIGNKNDSKTIISTEKEEKSLFNFYLDKENNLQISVKDKNKQIKNIITVNKDQIKKDNWHFALVNWKKLGEEYKFNLYLDDKNYEAKVKDVEDFSGGITSIGSSSKGTQILEGYLERFVYSNKNLSVEEIGTLKQKKDIKSQNIKVTNNYTYENDKIKTVSHNGFSYIFNYDVFGNTTSVNVGNQQLINNKYEARTDKLLESTYGNGDKTSLDYDSTDAVIGKRFNGQLKYKYEHDANGNLGYKEDLENGVNYRYIYDVADRLVKVEDSKGNYFTTDYDKNNNKSKIIERINGKVYTTSYSYDKDNRVKDTILPSGSKVLNNYDSIGRTTKRELNTGKTSLNTTFNFEAGYKGSQTNRISSMKNNNKEILYTYDKNGNIETIKSEGKIIKYHYNSLNEVIREDNEPLGKTIVYNYDVGGNITSKTEYEYVGSQKLGKEIKTYNYAYGDSNWKDKLTNFDGKEITYDAIGNPLSYDGYKFSWEQGRQLKSISGNNKNIAYKYNDSGIRTEKNVNGEVTRYHLNGSDVAYEETLDSTGKVKDSIYYNYDASEHLVSMTLNGEEYFYIRNAQNDIIALTDKSGKEVVTYNYDTWGKLISIEGSLKGTVGIKNPYRYRGYRYDIETGLYYLNSRYYNPSTCRMLNADSIGGKIGQLLSHNVFAYCFNNPINMSDEGGNWPKWAKGLAIAAATAVTVAAVVVATPVAACSIGMGIAMYIGASASTALAITSIATVGGYGIAMGIGVFGANRAYGAVRGKNVIRDKVFKGNRRAYNTAERIVNAAGVLVINTAASSPGGTCFLAGTLICTEKGYVPIEQVKVGDLVYSENPETGEKTLKTVLATYVKETNQLIYVYVGNEKIETTVDHPFYVEGKGWVKAFNLKIGEALVLKNGERKLIKNVEIKEFDESLTVYNFQVADFNTYYVTRDAILVHNANCGKKTQKMGRIKGNAPRSNQAQNKQFRSIVKEFKLDKEEQRLLHDSITGQGYDYQEIRDEAIYLFPRLDK